jgi:Archaeal PaREP1/PaREP8 family.
MVVELVERPLPRPSDAAYVEARLLEALGEARLALEFLERGLTRNAACKAFPGVEGAYGGPPQA